MSTQTVVTRQWWDLAHEMVKTSHEAGVDLSFAVRSGVRYLYVASFDLEPPESPSLST